MMLGTRGCGLQTRKARGAKLISLFVRYILSACGTACGAILRM